MLDNASFTAEDGKVTGFLGPNGAGKSTTMRAALGLVTPNAGRALVDGVPFVKTPSSMTAVGAVLDAKSAHKGRSAYTYLRGLALTNGIPRPASMRSSNSPALRAWKSAMQERSRRAGPRGAVELTPDERGRIDR